MGSFWKWPRNPENIRLQIGNNGAVNSNCVFPLISYTMDVDVVVVGGVKQLIQNLFPGRVIVELN